MIGSSGGLLGICVRASPLVLQHRFCTLPHSVETNRAVNPASFFLIVSLLNSAVNEDDEFVVESFWRPPCCSEWLIMRVVDGSSICSARRMLSCSGFKNRLHSRQRFTYSTALVFESPLSLVSAQSDTQEAPRLTSTPTNLHHHQDR